MTWRECTVTVTARDRHVYWKTFTKLNKRYKILCGPFKCKRRLLCFYTLGVKIEAHLFSLRSASPDTSSFVTIFLLSSVLANIRARAVPHADAMASSEFPISRLLRESRLVRSGSTCFAESTRQDQQSSNCSTCKPHAWRYHVLPPYPLWSADSWFEPCYPATTQHSSAGWG